MLLSKHHYSHFTFLSIEHVEVDQNGVILLTAR